MKFRQLTVLSLILGFTAPAMAQLPRIVVQGTGTPAVFTDLADAVAAAQAGDKLYLSGNNFPFPANLEIDKELHFFGAGVHPDSTQVTGTTTLTCASTAEPLRVLTTASGSTFTGIRFTTTAGDFSSLAIQYGVVDADDDPTDIVFQRCWFQGQVQLGTGPDAGGPTTFDECVFLGRIDGMGRSATLTRCIIANGYNTITLTGLDGASTVENCVVLGTIQTNNGVTIRNSFLRTNGGYASFACTNCVFQNNITPNQLIADASPGVVATGNLTDVDLGTLFVAESNGMYEVTDDLHMVAGSPGIGFGTDGTDVGIYGTASPYKPGAVPFNPHFRQATIAPSTNNNGGLPVNIRVAAQQH
ncbi:MAG: hypothetical protein IT230_07835 [Flavobacteriales bacterium]|nr:hypothetical protein [Flavobacteriales bacterium]